MASLTDAGPVNELARTGMCSPRFAGYTKIDSLKQNSDTNLCLQTICSDSLNSRSGQANVTP
ncbi:hypothetical protein ALP93_200270 [Pseudomonas syringae pv. helianthi]|nr:hypothetical protein ALP93_200270 [Pseudomonas syringae pv. helianthi]